MSGETYIWSRLRVSLLGLALLLVGGGLAGWSCQAWLNSEDAFAQFMFGRSGLVLSLGCVLFAAGSIMLITSRNRRSPAWLRLDLYLSMLRRPKDDRVDPADGLLYGFLRRTLPGSWFSNRSTKRRGWVRNFLQRIGPTWRMAPIRRLVQAGCLLLFLGLFFYVCWPYDARPAAPGESSAGWQLREITGEGNFVFENTTPPEWLNETPLVYLAEAEAGPAAEPKSIAMKVTQKDAASLTLSEEKPLTEAEVAWLLERPGPWAMHSVDPHAWPSHYAENISGKQLVPAEMFLAIDPLVSISTAIASRNWVWSLFAAGVILLACVLIPRGFCGYLCPLGTTIDFFDWLVGKRVTRFRVAQDGWWVHIKYFLLLGVLVAAGCGVLISGYVAAIPVITRGALFIGDPVQSGLLRGWRLVPGMNWGHLVSVLLFFSVLGLGLLRPRFWCKYVCPSGAVFSLGNLFRITERKVESSCINCNKCVEVCPFDAIKPDYTTRVTDCTLCQTCAGVCPTHAIKFVERSNLVELKVPGDPPTGETALGRRGFLSAAIGVTAGVVGGAGFATAINASSAFGAVTPEKPLIRPPGSVPEEDFLQMCIRCGECFKACPNNVLQVEGFEQGLAGLWAPMVNANWAGCESSCNACGQVCPTGAIRELDIAEKRVARMGLAIVNEETCLPFAGKEECDLCVQECNAAGYRAIEYTQVGVQVDPQGAPVDGSGFLAPVVIADKCVGCGLCQTRCHAINVKEKHLLTESAIIVEAGPGKEDRLLEGSYIELRKREAEAAKKKREFDTPPTDFFVPDQPVDDDPFSLDPPADPEKPDKPVDNPFGL